MHTSIISRWSILVCMIFVLLLQSSCANDTYYGDADELLTIALSKLKEKEQITLYGTSTALISGFTYVENQQLNKGNHQQWIKSNQTDSSEFAEWNTLLNIEQLMNVNKEVSINNSLSNSQLTVIEMKIDPLKIEQIIKKSLLDELHQIKNENEAFSDNNREKREKVIKQAELRLNEMLDTLKVQSVYELGIDKESTTASTLEVSTVMSYSNDGIQREEVIKGSYTFEIFDKDAVIPQNL